MALKKNTGGLVYSEKRDRFIYPVIRKCDVGPSSLARGRTELTCRNSKETLENRRAKQAYKPIFSTKMSNLSPLHLLHRLPLLLLLDYFLAEGTLLAIFILSNQSP